MKKQYRVNCAIILLISFFSCHAEIVNPDIKSEIDGILKKQVPVYQLDLKTNEENFERIDSWFQQYVDLNGFTCTYEDRMGPVQCKLKLSKNIPIISTDNISTIIRSPKPFNIYYTKGPRKRALRKALWIPSKIERSKDYIKQLANKFMYQYGYYKQTNNDKIDKAFVVSWRTRPLDLNIKKTEVSTILHRVKFSRVFQGLEVINSKQIVDFHPESLELLSYKNISWTPVNESSGKFKQYLTMDEVLSQIHAFMKEDGDASKIKEVRLAWYQSPDLIFPVMLVKTERVDREIEIYPIEHALVISLVKGLRLDNEDYAFEKPEK